MDEVLERLIALFEGKKVRIVNSDPRIKDASGKCKTIHRVPGSENEFTLELEDGRGYGFGLKFFTKNLIVGEVGISRFNRKIEII